MCGYIGNVVDSPLTKVLMDLIGHDLWPQLRNNPGTGPAANIDIVLGEQGPQVRQAIWWLLLEPKDGQFRIGNVTDSPPTKALMLIIGIYKLMPELRTNSGIGPAASTVLLNDWGL